MELVQTIQAEGQHQDVSEKHIITNLALNHCNMGRKTKKWKKIKGRHMKINSNHE